MGFRNKIDKYKFYNMPKKRHPDYQCPRCGYETNDRAKMRRHFNDNRKKCPGTVNIIELSQEICNHVLENRIYKIPKLDHIVRNNHLDNGSQPQTKFKNETKINCKPILKMTASNYIPKRIKDLVWDTYVGNEVAQTGCFTCNITKINMRSFDCGHVIAKSKGGRNEVVNLRPVCQPCNNSMGTKNMLEFCIMHGLDHKLDEDEVENHLHDHTYNIIKPFLGQFDLVMDTIYSSFM